MKKRRERRKLLIVLSDGNPASCNSGDDSGYLKLVCQDIESDGSVDLIGIGLGVDTVRQYYKNHIIISDVSQLEVELIQLLRGMMTV